MITVINPSTGATGASYEEADNAAVDAACAAAREAFPGWSDLLVTERAEFLWRYADILEHQRAELIKVLGDEVERARQASEDTSTKDDHPEAKLLNGPQLPGNANDQDEIDRLLASFD